VCFALLSGSYSAENLQGILQRWVPMDKRRCYVTLTACCNVTVIKPGHSPFMSHSPAVYLPVCELDVIIWFLFLLSYITLHYIEVIYSCLNRNC